MTRSESDECHVRTGSDVEYFETDRASSSSRSAPATGKSGSDALVCRRRGKDLGKEARRAALSSFAQAVMPKYGTVSAAFKAFDPNSSGRIVGYEFCQVAEHLYDGDLTLVFRALDADRRGSISMREFQVVEDIYQEFVEKRSGEEARMITE